MLLTIESTKSCRRMWQRGQSVLTCTTGLLTLCFLLINVHLAQCTHPYAKVQHALKSQKLSYPGCQGQGRHRSKRSEDANQRHPTTNATPRNGPSQTGKALYLSGNQGLKWIGKDILPNQEFSVALWIKPEGGQVDPVHVIGKCYTFRTCFH